MAFSFSSDDLDRIASVLGVPAKPDDGTFRFELFDEDSGRQLKLELLSGLPLPDAVGEDDTAALVVAITPGSYVQLQACTGFIASQELGEVIFFAKRGGTTSGLVVERQAACSLFANVDDRLLSADFTQLPPEMVMSTVALSMTEDLFDNLG